MRREDVEGAGAKGKGKGAFKVCYGLTCVHVKLVLTLQGSVFVEFAYEKEMTAFLESEEPKKYTEESTEEITKMTKCVLPYPYPVQVKVAGENLQLTR